MWQILLIRSIMIHADERLVHGRTTNARQVLSDMLAHRMRGLGVGAIKTQLSRNLGNKPKRHRRRRNIKTLSTKE